MAVADQSQDRLGVGIGGGVAGVAYSGFPQPRDAFQREQRMLTGLAVD